VWDCKGKDFGLFRTLESAEKDAQWLEGYQKKEGLPVKKPTVYRVKFVRVTKKKGKK